MRTHIATVAALLALLITACGDDGSSAQDAGSADTDTDSDTDTDADADTDTNADAGSDSGSLMTPADYNAPTPVEWIEFDGGTFLQGSTSSLYPASYSETPAHDVTVPSFQMMKTEVTTSQYAQCVLDGACEELLVAIPDSASGSNCNWLVWGRENHPANCIYIWQAEAYCARIGARLPSESEWEYAARSRGKDNEYPWGQSLPTCDYAVMNDTDTGDGCDLGHTWPVCSKPAGNTEQGLCDMAGNVQEWMQDCFYSDYTGAPVDGSAWMVGDCEDNVLRGGDYRCSYPAGRTRLRFYNPSSGRADFYGFRCVKDAE